jgi:1-phosphatidylinositol phosphodiesterase
MTSQQTTLCIVNTSGIDITNVQVSEIDNFDWDGDSRPDHNFQGATILNNNSRCEREELNANARSVGYRMTLKFTNGTELSFRNDQKDAETKYDRFYEVTGSAANSLTIYQTSGGYTNAMYIREKQEPDNSSWMGRLLMRKPDVRFNAITMPGSHDAGMYSATNCTTAAKPEWTITQSYSIEGQLKSGSRYFDLRVYFDGTNFRIGHFGKVPILGSEGCYGAILSDVLNQVKDFIQSSAGKSEAIILRFSHTMGDSPYDKPVNEVTQFTINQVKEVFGTYLYTSQNSGANLAQTLLSEVSGKIVTVFDDEYKDYYDVKSGIFPYRDVPSGGYGLRVFDQYSDTDSFPVMSDDQKKKLTTSGGYGKDYLFLLSWTLTGKSDLLDIQVLSTLARPWLPQVLTDIQNKKLNPPNIIYYDFVDPYINRAIIDLN